MLQEIELQQKIQREYFELFIKEILEAFGYSRPPAPRYSLKILFEEPISILAIVERDDKRGEGLIPIPLEVTGTTISGLEPFDDECLDRLRLEVKIEGKEDSIPISKWRLKQQKIWDSKPPPSEIEIHPPPVRYYLFTGKALYQILEALKENATKKSQLREWPGKEEVVRPC